MKALIVTSHLDIKKGYGRFSYDLVKNLQKNNFDILVICNKANTDFPEIKQVPILPPPSGFKKVFFLAWFYAFKSFWRVKNLRQYDLIHCHVESYSLFVFILSKLTGLKYFLQAHGTFGIVFFKYKIYGFLQRIVYKNAYKIICVSNYTKKRILEHGKFVNLTVIPNGVNLEKFNGVCVESKDEKENILLGVGSFKERKGFNLVIRALSVVKETIPDVKYYIVCGSGDEKYRQELINLPEKLNVKENVFFFEKISDDELKNLYKKAKIFVLTSISDEYNFEGFGLVYLEANAFGVPVIGSYDSGAEEAIKDGYNGFLTKQKDVDDIAQKIIALLSDEKLRKKLSENAIEWSKNLSWDKVVKEYIKIYQE